METESQQHQPPPEGPPPIAPYPANYGEGFLRPYYVAEMLASRVLQTQSHFAAAGAYSPAQGGGGDALLCGAVSAVCGLGVLGGPSNPGSRLSVRVCMMQTPSTPQAGENPYTVCPPQRVNPQTTRKTTLHRTPSVSPDWDAGVAMWQGIGAQSNPDVFVHPIGVTGPSWDYLKGYLLFQLFLEEDAPQPPFRPTSTSANAAAKALPRGTTSTLQGQAILRICDLFAAASLPFVPSVSGLYGVLHGEGARYRGADAPDTAAAVASTSDAFPPRQEFFLRMWLNLSPTGTKKGGAGVSMGGKGDSKRGGPAVGGGGRGDQPLSIATTISLVLPRGIVVPSSVLLPPPSPPLGVLGGGGMEDVMVDTSATSASNFTGGSSSRSSGGVVTGMSGSSAGGGGGNTPHFRGGASATAASTTTTARLGSASSTATRRAPSASSSSSRRSTSTSRPMPRIPIPGDLVAAAEAAALANPSLAGYLNGLPIPRHLTKRHGSGSSSGGTRRGRSKGATHRSSSTSSRNSVEEGAGQSSHRSAYEGSHRPGSSAASANATAAAHEAAKGQYLMYLKDTLLGMNQSLRQVRLVVQKGVGTVQRSRSFRGENSNFLPANFLDESVLQKGIEDLKRSHSELLNVTAGMM